jgi:SAM-dependent methyltransferase
MPRSSPARAERAESSFSRYELYERCVQNPTLLAGLLRAIHGGRADVLGEDFCGSAALSREWVRPGSAARAIAVDLDPEPLARAREGLTPAQGKRITAIRANVLKPSPAARAKADVVFVGNFSIGEIHARRDLLRYLKIARSRLKRGGVFVCDTYGGETAFARGATTRYHPGPGDKGDVRIRYIWQQRQTDPLTGLVENALHFRVERAGEVVQEITDAFVYRWRLWSVPELRDAMREAGFARTDVYAQLPDARDAGGTLYARPIEDPEEIDESFIVCVAGRIG